MAAYEEFGSWLSRCYDHPVASMAAPTTLVVGAPLLLNLTGVAGSAATIDRVVLREELRDGQLILSYSTEALLGGSWTPLASGQSVGNKRIDLVADGKAVKAEALRVTVNSAVAGARPRLKAFSAFLCDWPTGHDEL